VVDSPYAKTRDRSRQVTPPRRGLRSFTMAAVPIALAAWAMAACAPTYTPVCRGDDNNPLDAGELSQPAGMALRGAVLYVASGASVAPDAERDYCGSFLTPFDAATGQPAGRPLVPRDPALEGSAAFYRFFGGLLYDEQRDVFYATEREQGSILKIDPATGRILDRVVTGPGAYDLEMMQAVPTRWDGATTVRDRDVLAVADLGGAGQPGRLWVIDLDAFAEGARPVSLGAPGLRPSAFAYDPADFTLYVALFDGSGIVAIDATNLRALRATETLVAQGPTPVIRGLAAVTEATPKRLYFTTEARAQAGVWVADALTGELIDILPLNRPPFKLAVYEDQLIGLSVNRLYLFSREPLALTQSFDIAASQPSRLLVDPERKRAYVTALSPSVVHVVELP
jgi:hypothetical protein